MPEQEPHDPSNVSFGLDIGVPISATGRSTGMKIVLGLARDAGDAWHWRPYRSLAPGPTRRVAHCCYEHVGQNFVFPNEAPGQPVLPPTN
jgi:hypothetical protein